MKIGVAAWRCCLAGLDREVNHADTETRYLVNPCFSPCFKGLKMMNSSTRSAVSSMIPFRITRLVLGIAVLGGAVHADPMTSNNGLYPTAEEFSGRYIVANLDYPKDASTKRFPAGGSMGQALTVENAGQYMRDLKDHIGPSFSTLINDPDNWDPVKAEWYDLVWSGAGEKQDDGSTDPTSGREALMNTYTGQIVHKTTFLSDQPKTEWVQNHAVMYYNDHAATMLGRVWADLYDADLSELTFPDGSIVVKAEATTPTIAEWSDVLDGAATWKVFRPTTEDQGNKVTPLKATVVEAHPLQLSIKVKDSIASPETGWVYMAFIYNAKSPGVEPWDRFDPFGAMWGNDPQFANDPKGLPQGEQLTETWVNPNGPAFARDTLGWGGRMAGPMDVATRQGVITTDGKQFGPKDIGASSCISCHSSAEFPFTMNLYPSPNRSFPRNGEPFLLYEPGSDEWAQWFQNRPGNESMSQGRGAYPTDYDMAIMFALGATAKVTGKPGLAVENFDAH
jgi:hypothetical protein